MPADRGFYCVIGVQGEGELRGTFGTKPIRRGKSYFIPRTLPGYEVFSTGQRPLEVYCAYPPNSPAASRRG